MKRRTESHVERKHVWREQRGVNRRVKLEIRIAWLEVVDFPGPLDADGANLESDIQFLLNVPRQTIKARDDDCGSPVAGLDAEHFELGRQQGRVEFGLGNVGINSVDEGVDNGRAAGMVPIQFLGEIATIHEEPVANVTPQFLLAQDLGDRAGGLPAPQFQLEQSIAGDVVALREK